MKPTPTALLRLRDDLQKHFPDLSVKYQEPLQDDGTHTLDLERVGHMVVLEWSPQCKDRIMFSDCADPDHVGFTGADCVFGNDHAVTLRHIIQFIAHPKVDHTLTR